MHSTFENLDPEKKKRIIDAALKEFSDHDYEHASTNRIVKNAGIGKGMLFYYFNSKKDFYHYLMHYALDNTFAHLIHEYKDEMKKAEGDFIERYYIAARLKAESMRDNPHEFNFMGMIVLQDLSSLPTEIQGKIKKLQEEGYSTIYQDIDYALFKDKLDVKKAMNLIRWSLDGYQSDLENRLKGKPFSSVDLKEYWDEFYDYLDILKEAYYK